MSSINTGNWVDVEYLGKVFPGNNRINFYQLSTTYKIRNSLNGDTQFSLQGEEDLKVGGGFKRGG